MLSVCVCVAFITKSASIVLIRRRPRRCGEELHSSAFSDDPFALYAHCCVFRNRAAVVAARDAAVKETGRRVPILVKMGDLGDAKRTVQFLSRLGVDGVVALNTQKDYASFKLPPADEALLTQRRDGGRASLPSRRASLQRSPCRAGRSGRRRPADRR